MLYHSCKSFPALVNVADRANLDSVHRRARPTCARRPLHGDAERGKSRPERPVAQVVTLTTWAPQTSVEKALFSLGLRVYRLASPRRHVSLFRPRHTVRAADFGLTRGAGAA